MRTCLATLVALMLAGCAPAEPPWYRGLAPDSPCYRVDLADGLDETSTVEVRDTFACLDHHGHLAALRPTVDALEAHAPASGVPAGVELARSLNALPRAGVDVVTLLESGLSLVQGDPEAGTHAQDLLLELAYGTRATLVRREDFDLTDPARLEAGPLAAAAPAVPGVARAVLDDDLAATDQLADVLEDPSTHRWLRTIDGWVTTPDPRVEAPVDRLLPGLGGLVLAARSPGNDRWAGASGDSLRDLVDVATAGTPDLVDRSAPALARVLDDPVVQEALPDLLVDLHRAGHLQVTAAQATWLAQVDVEGGRLDPGEDSALTALLRLLASTNRPLRCELDVVVTTLDVDLGNLAVALLEILADQDPDAVQGAAALLGEVLGYGGDQVLEALATTGACPAFTPQVARDLRSLDRLSEPQARGLTHTLIGLVRVLRDGRENHVVDLVDTVEVAWDHGAVPPLEEVLRDTGEARVIEDLVALVPVMDDPLRYGVTARGAPAATLSDLLRQARWLVAVDPEDGRTGWARIEPLLAPALSEDGTFRALGRAAEVMAAPGSALGRAQDLLPPLLDADPDLALLTALAPALRDRQVVAPALRLAETPGVTDAVLAARPAGADQTEVPLAFAGRLIRTGALDDLLATVRLVLRGLEGVGEPPGDGTAGEGDTDAG